jgi:hypothetical protein
MFAVFAEDKLKDMPPLFGVGIEITNCAVAFVE